MSVEYIDFVNKKIVTIQVKKRRYYNGLILKELKELLKKKNNSQTKKS